MLPYSDEHSGQKESAAAAIKITGQALGED
jgi:hypothetical protein